MLVKHNSTRLLKSTNLYEEANRRYNELLKVVEQKEKALEKAPPGKIHIITSRKRAQYYLRSDEKDVSGSYISKKDLSTIITYLQKAYDEKILKLIKKELINLECFIRKSLNIQSKIQEVYSKYPDEVKNLIQPVDISDDDYKVIWESQKYVGKEIREGSTVWETEKGEMVRSKSELNIANALKRNNIPYRYEYPFQLRSGAIIYPDFTILDIKRRKILYWEHRGMMDDRDYVRHAVVRNKDFLKNGVIPGDNLIITEESSTTPLGTDEIDIMINWIQHKDRV